MGNASRAAHSSINSVVCPHCDAAHPDDWECLELDLITRMRCSECRRSFAFYFAQCSCCSEESLYVWATEPSPYWRATLVCQSCGEPSYEFIKESTDSAPVR